MSKFVYLASQSPRRSQLLTQLGVRHELLLPDAAEDAEGIEAVLPNEPPTRYVQRVTRLKLEAAMQRLKRRGLPIAPVLCADTTVAMGARIYGKPTDARDVHRILGELSGRSHRVLTAVAVGRGHKIEAALSVSQVTFAELDKAWIRRYEASGEPMGKAGAYAIQGAASARIRQIRGSYSGIMGLPMYETAEVLRHFGFKL